MLSKLKITLKNHKLWSRLFLTFVLSYYAFDIKQYTCIFVKAHFTNTGKSQTGQRSASYVKDIVTKWEKEFATKGVPEPESSAQLIAAYVFGKKMVMQQK